MTTVSIRRLLVANRGEIAVRIIRGARDAGIASIAAYAEPDRDSLFVRLADEAYALGGASPAETYLDADKLLAIASRAGADAVHPGYGFLAENADFARRVIDAGLTWIGPPPEAIDLLGDKVSARRLAAAVGAPLVPGTPGPIEDADAAVAFAREHGLPIAIKAAFGGGGRGLRVARTEDDIPEQFASATREAVLAFGRGECFVERYLDHPRHVETQCLADQQGNVVVISTRDCSLQRRHQKLVEEAPAPFLTAEQTERLYAASKDLLRAAGYVGAGTCEFLIDPDGTIAFLEVNTRLQVEHPVSEQVTGIDLVAEQFRIAAGEPIGYDDPPMRGHSIEFRLNAEDPARGFLPAPGTLTAWQPASGPGVRVDEGYHAGMTVPGAFDSLIAKLIVTGNDREQAIARARRAVAETVVAGMPTLLPFHAAVLDADAFVAPDGKLRVHTRWAESEFHPDLPAQPTPEPEGDRPHAAPVTVEVNGKRFEVRLPAGLGSGRVPAPVRPSRRPGAATRPQPSGHALTAPMQGTIVRVAVTEGQRISEGDPVLVLEAMKMEQPINAHRSGVVRGLRAEAGSSVASGAVLCEIVDE